MEISKILFLLSSILSWTAAVDVDPTAIESAHIDHHSVFTTTFESYFPIIDRVYRFHSLSHPEFEENVSLSMYRYYMSQHLYARLIQIRSAHGLSTKSDETFVKHLHSIAPRLRCPEFTYLEGIGDIKLEVKNIKYFFEYSFPVWPNSEGHFGRVDANSHWKYMSFPAPSVVAQAIREDYRISPKTKYNPDWDLNEDLQPMPKTSCPGSPTANLLGWKPAEPLTLQQRKHLISCGINDVDFDETNSQFFFNPKLVKIIYDYSQMNNKREGDNIHVNNYSNMDKSTSMGISEQLGWLERNQQNDLSLSRSFPSVDRRVTGMWHPLQRGEVYSPILSQRKTLMLGYRVKKLNGMINDWAVYDCKNYQSVPDDWVATRNTVFDFGGISESDAMIIAFSEERDSLRYRFMIEASC